MKQLLTLLITGLVLVVGGCRVQAVDSMARTTSLVDRQFAAAYTDFAELCLDASGTRAEYDACLAPWAASADAVRALRNATLALDVATDRKTFRAAACQWFRALAVLDSISPVDLPAATVGLTSRWNNRC